MAPQTEQRPTAAYVDLDTLAGNFHSTKQFVGTNLKYMAVVKANAYGHGLVECAGRLESEDVDWFGVAIPEEGIELRRAGIKSPILCLGSFWPGQESLLIKHKLTPVIYDRDNADSLNKCAQGLDRVVDIHVKIDTGMGRVGIPYGDASSFALAIKQKQNLRITGLLTHFASAENPAENEFTNLQIERFAKAEGEFRAAGHEPELIDLANSPGAITHPASRGNMVRLGGALYGLLDDILPPGTTGPKLRPVLSLISRIADLRTVPAGESLGYGRTFYTQRDSLIGLLPIGYADGYPRALSNTGKAVLNRQIVPIVGRISMDWTLLDLTDVPGVKNGDEVILIGPEITAADIARVVGTIGYEITCGLSPRVPRIYT